MFSSKKLKIKKNKNSCFVNDFRLRGNPALYGGLGTFVFA